MQSEQICIMRKLSVLYKFWCSLSMLQLSDFMFTSFQIDEFTAYYFFHSCFIACCSAFFSDLRIWSCQLSAHYVCFLSVIKFLLMLLWQKCFQIFLHVFLIISFMSDFLCCWWKLASLMFRYRSSRRMCVSVFRIIISMILYASIITHKHLFCILTSFLTDSFL